MLTCARLVWLSSSVHARSCAPPPKSCSPTCPCKEDPFLAALQTLGNTATVKKEKLGCQSTRVYTAALCLSLAAKLPTCPQHHIQHKVQPQCVAMKPGGKPKTGRACKLYKGRNYNVAATLSAVWSRSRQAMNRPCVQSSNVRRASELIQSHTEVRKLPQSSDPHQDFDVLIFTALSNEGNKKQRTPVIRRQVRCNHTGLWVAVQDRLTQLLAKAAAHILRSCPTYYPSACPLLDDVLQSCIRQGLPLT